MNEYIMCKCMNECMIYKFVNAWMHEWINVWINLWKNERINTWMTSRMNDWLDKWLTIDQGIHSWGWTKGW